MDRRTVDGGDAVGRIAEYFAACSTGTSDEIAAHFIPDAVLYDTNFPAVRGARAIGQFWVAVRKKWQGAVWTVDSAHSEGTRAVCEWTMTGLGPIGQAFAFHGSDHYDLATDGRIAEIRQYWTFDPERLDTGLVGYDYGDREED